MLHSCSAISRLTHSAEAGSEIGKQIHSKIGNPDVVFVFASSRHDYASLLKSIDAECHPKVMGGASSAGEFSKEGVSEGSVSVLALRSTEMVFNIGKGGNLAQNPADAAKQCIASFEGTGQIEYPYRTAILFADSLGGYTEEFVDAFNKLTHGAYQLFGGGAADDGHFKKTDAFFGTECFTNGVVAIEVLSKKPLGVGAQHSWSACGPILRVTQTDGMAVKSLNATPAAEVFESYAREGGQQFDRSKPLDFFLHNVLGVKVGSSYKLRVPLAVRDDGSIVCAAELPLNSVSQIMRTEHQSALDAAASATVGALSQLQTAKPKAALFFDCIATRLRMGSAFGSTLDAARFNLGSEVDFAGFNSYGQIARLTGQYAAFHNCTAVACVFPE